MKKESSFEKKFLAQVKKITGAYIPPKTDPGGIRGLPDRVLCIGGRYVALEFKRSMKDALINSPRHALQAHTLELIDRAGGYGRIVYPEIAERVLEQIGRFNEGRDQVFGKRKTSSI